jgi:P27 family predicted phage terminase small subunit
MNRAYSDKALDGFPSKRKEEIPDIAEPSGELAAPPAHLDATGVKLWNDLVKMMGEMKVLTPADWLSLVVLADAYSMYIKATEALEREGMVIEVGQNGYQQQGSFVSIRDRAQELILLSIGSLPCLFVAYKRQQPPVTRTSIRSWTKVNRIG